MRPPLRGRGEHDAVADIIAAAFHDHYERLAPDYGYETREESRKAWGEVPERNRALMRATVRSLLNARIIATPGSARDWTVDPLTGRSNSSPEFEHLVGEVTRLIRDEAHALLSGRADMTAALILAQLAHVHGLAPATTTNQSR